MTLNQRFRPPSGGSLACRSPEHPRLRMRRVGIRRDEGRRRLRLVTAAAVATVMVAALWLAVRSPVLDVDRITVAGTQRNVPAAVVASSGVRKGQPLGDVDESEVARRIEKLPWVRDAVVRRQWPGTVSIALTERVETAVTRTFADHWALLDGTGRVLAWVPQRPPHLPVVTAGSLAGAPATRVDPATAGLVRVAQVVPPSLVPRVGAITARGPEVELQLVPQGVARLGPPPAAAAKVTAVEAILARVDPTSVAAIDARIPSGAVLTRR